MVQSVAVLTERALAAADAGRLVALHDPDGPPCRVLVPAGGRRNLLADVLDHLSLLELREAVGAAAGHDERTAAEAAADVERLRGASCAALGVDGERAGRRRAGPGRPP